MRIARLACLTTALTLGACATRTPGAEIQDTPIASNPVPPLDRAPPPMLPAQTPDEVEIVKGDATPAPEADEVEIVKESAPTAPDSEEGGTSPGRTQAAEAEEDAYEEGCKRPEASDDPARIGDVQEMIEETTCSAALWLDGLFGEERNLESARRTSGYVEGSTSYSEFDGPDNKLRFRVRLRLPNLKNRFNVIVGRESEEEVTRDRTERFAVRSQLSGVEDDTSWLAGLGYSFPGNARFSSNSRIGVSNLTSPRVFVQQATRYVLYTDENDLTYVRATPFWNSDDGFGLTSGINHNHVLSPRFMLRFTEVGTASEKTDGYDWFTAAILYQNLREDRGLAYQLLVRGATQAAEPLREYGGRVVYHHPLIPQRLNAELLAGYTWPREDPDLKREGSAEIGLSLQMPFGDRKYR